MSELITLDRAVLDRARISRDARFDGKFFIAVTSTGIYCRPICPAPQPKQSNVRYYETAAGAAEAGFRPCLRCRPESAPGTPAWLGTSAVVRRALRLIQDGALDTTSVDDLAARIGIGPRHLLRLFTQHVGASPIAVAQTRRLHFAKRLLDETDLPVTEVAMASGFGSLRRFNFTFRRTYQRTPTELRLRRRGNRPAADRDEVVLRLAYRPPYDWAHIRAFLATRAVPGVERVDEQSYSRTVACDGRHATIRVSVIEGQNALELRVRGAAPATLFQISAAARRVFDLAADPAPIAQVFRSDPLLAPLVKARPGLRIPGAWDPFECSVRALLGQQVTVAGARTLAARIVARIGQPISEGADGLTHLFPTPAILATANLDGLGITGARINALHALSRAIVDGKLDFSVGEDEVVKTLVALPGFGLWTAQYIALRGLGQPDAFPTGDLVLRQMAANGDTPLSTRELEARAEAWRPWRGYAVMHLWGAASAFRAAKAEKVKAGKKSAKGKKPARAAASTISP